MMLTILWIDQCTLHCIYDICWLVYKSWFNAISNFDLVSSSDMSTLKEMLESNDTFFMHGIMYVSVLFPFTN